MMLEAMVRLGVMKHLLEWRVLEGGPVDISRDPIIVEDWCSLLVRSCSSRALLHHVPASAISSPWWTVGAASWADSEPGFLHLNSPEPERAEPSGLLAASRAPTASARPPDRS